MCEKTSCQLSECGGWVARHGTSVMKAEVFHNERVSLEKLVFTSAEKNIWIDDVCVASVDQKYWVLSVYSQQQTRPGKKKRGVAVSSRQLLPAFLLLPSVAVFRWALRHARLVSCSVPRCLLQLLPTSQDEEVPPTRRSQLDEKWWARACIRFIDSRHCPSKCEPSSAVRRQVKLALRGEKGTEKT